MRVGAIGVTLAFLLIAGLPFASFAGPSDKDGDTISDSADNCPTVPNPSQTNSDPDTHGDLCDNCSLVDNDGQFDCDLDGYGNPCDPDTSPPPGDGGVGAPDFIAFKVNFGMAVPPGDICVDYNVDGGIGAPDFIVFKLAFGGAPGPSGLSCADCTPGGCNVPCVPPVH